MAFANLFTKLSAVDDDVASFGQPACPHRTETEDGQRGNARKRKTQGEQTGPHKKKRCYQDQTTRTYNATTNNSKAVHYHVHNTDGDHASVTKEVIHSHTNKAGHNNMCYKGQNYKIKNDHNVKKGKKKQRQQKDSGRPAYGGGNRQTSLTLRKCGGYSNNKNVKQEFQVKGPRSMTQEFMDQNALLVDGRLLCRHFLWGRCIKGDDCQLEHIQSHNDLVKEVCKFYVQGFCTKGGSCPYMHKSFPCKYFHRRGKCSQGADCRFSHDPLNDVTSRLLDEALKRENDLYELAKKAEQESSGQPANTDESEIMEASTTPDVLKQPLRPNFYKSAETNAGEEALLCKTEGLADNMEEAVPPRTSDAARPHSPPPANLNHEEPVCYSVEAVLGPQLSRPFTGFLTTARSQESSPLSSSESQVPYSVDAVLRSCKSVENFTFGHTPTSSTAQTVSYTPKTHFEETTDPLSSNTRNEKVLNSVNTRNEANNSQEEMFKCLPSLQAHTGLISENCPNLTLASGDHKKQATNMPQTPKPPQRASQSEVKLESTDITSSGNCENHSVLPFRPTKHEAIFSRPSSQASASKHPTQSKSHLSVLSSDSQASFKPVGPSSGFKDFKGIAAVPAEPVNSSNKSSGSLNSVSRHFSEKRLPEIHLRSKKTQSGLKLQKQHVSTENTAECSSKMAHCGDLASGCKKTPKRPFHSLFSSPITDTMHHRDDSITSSSCPQSLNSSSCPAPQSADCRSYHLKTVLAPDKASARPFLSLFAAPLSAAPLPSMQSQPDYSRTSFCSVDNQSHLSDSKQRAPDLETPLPRQVSTEQVNRPTKQLVNPVCSLVSDSLSEMSASPANSPSTTPAHEQLADVSSHKGSAAAASANSVLKTLFLCLSPYQQDGEQQDSIQITVPSQSEKKDKNSTGCVFVKQQRSKKKGRQKKKFETQDSHKQSAEKIGAGGSTLSSPGMTEPQVKNCGTHNLPFKPVMPLIQHHTRPRLEHMSEEGKGVNGNMVATPLKDLFKTLDASVFHFGH